MLNQFGGDADIPDQKMKVWLEERIVRLSLYRYELDSIGEQIEALDHHADYLQMKGQPLPEKDRAQRETLEGAYLGKTEEIQRAFEPTASHPFSPAEEMKVYCQMLSEVNERLKQQEQYQPQPKRTLRDLYDTDTEQPRQRDEPDRSR
jgi:hypothetical protein